MNLLKLILILVVISFLIIVTLPLLGPKVIQRSYGDKAKLAITLGNGLYRDPLNYLDEIRGANFEKVTITNSPMGFLLAAHSFQLAFVSKDIPTNCSNPDPDWKSCKILQSKAGYKYAYFTGDQKTAFLTASFSDQNYLTVAVFGQADDASIQKFIDSVEYKN